jgi:Amidase
VELTAPDISQAVADWAPLCAVEAAVAHATTYPARKDEYGPVLASVLEAGRAVTGLGYQEILLRRMTLRGRFAALFETADLMLTPVQPFAPLSLAEIQTLGEQPELILQLQRYTAPFDLTGSPTITLPGGFTGAGPPIGIQLDLDNALSLDPQAQDWTGRRLVRLIAGNPVTMGQMTRHVPDAGSYAPVTILIEETPEGGTHVACDSVAGQIAPYRNPAATEVARRLDTEVLRLLREATGVQAPAGPLTIRGDDLVGFHNSATTPDLGF